MTIIRADEAPRFDVPGVRFTAYAAPSRGSREVCTWQITVEPGAPGAAHTLDRDETFLVLAGQLRVTPGGDLLAVGDVAVVPAGQPIEVTSPGPGAARAYIAITTGFTATTADGTALKPPWAQ